MFSKTNAIALLAAVIGVGMIGATSAKADGYVYVRGGRYVAPVRTVVYEQPVYRRTVYVPPPRVYVPARTVVYSRPYYPAYRPVVRTYVAGPRYYRSYGRGVGFAYNRGYFGRGFAFGARW